MRLRKRPGQYYSPDSKVVSVNKEEGVNSVQCSCYIEEEKNWRLSIGYYWWTLAVSEFGRCFREEQKPDKGELRCGWKMIREDSEYGLKQSLAEKEEWQWEVAQNWKRKSPDKVFGFFSACHSFFLSFDKSSDIPLCWSSLISELKEKYS